MMGTKSITTKFECDNIEFKEAIIDEYQQCEVYPVYPALFYDYDADKHEQMVIEQLSPYLTAFGVCIIKLWHTFFIWIILKKIIFPLYFVLSTFLADKCCHGIRKNHFAKIHLTLKLNEQQYQKRLLKHQGKFKNDSSMVEYYGDMELIDLSDLKDVNHDNTECVNEEIDDHELYE